MADERAPKPQENYIQSAIAAGKELAKVARPGLVPDALPYVILKNDRGDEVISYVDGSIEVPNRKRGTVKLKDADSFLAYWKRHNADSMIYATLEPAAFIAVFNDHRGTAADFRDHRAVFTLCHSKEWTAWNSKNKQRFESNVAFAEWLEDQAADMVNPSGADMLQLALNFRVGETISFSNPVHLQSGQTQLNYSKIVEASSKNLAGTIAIPDTFTIEIPLFDGLAAPRYALDARFRFRLREGLLSIWYELIRPHKVVEEAFFALWQRIQVEAGIQVLYGTPE